MPYSSPSHTCKSWEEGVHHLMLHSGSMTSTSGLLDFALWMAYWYYEAPAMHPTCSFTGHKQQHIHVHHCITCTNLTDALIPTASRLLHI